MPLTTRPWINIGIRSFRWKRKKIIDVDARGDAGTGGSNLGDGLSCTCDGSSCFRGRVVYECNMKCMSVTLQFIPWALVQLQQTQVATPTYFAPRELPESAPVLQVLPVETNRTVEISCCSSFCGVILVSNSN